MASLPVVLVTLEEELLPYEVDLVKAIAHFFEGKKQAAQVKGPATTVSTDLSSTSLDPDNPYAEST